MASDVFGGHTPQHSMTNGVSAAPRRQRLRRFSVHEVGFFEGPEKLLEVWFDLCPLEDDESCGLSPALNGHDYEKGLRTFPR